MTNINATTCEILQEEHVSRKGFATGLAAATSRLLRSVKNRFAVNDLRHMSEDQLADMGLCRDDIAKALSQSVMLDPSNYLIRARQDPLSFKRGR